MTEARTKNPQSNKTMTEYELTDLVKRVKNVIDQNMESAGMEAFGDVDTLSLEQVIEENILPAAQLIEMSASGEMLGEGEDIPTDGMSTDPMFSSDIYKCKSVVLPKDFMRFMVFMMSDWRKVVTEPIDDTHPMYAMQRSSVMSVRGNPQKPVVAIVHGSGGLVLEAYTTAVSSTVSVAKYIAKPSVNYGKVKLCPLLVDAIVYAAAYLVANSYNAINQAQVFLSTAKSLAGIQSVQQPTNTEE